MNDPELHARALAAGATALGEVGTRQQYLFDLDQLRRFLAREELPPCPVEMPKNNRD